MLDPVINFELTVKKRQKIADCIESLQRGLMQERNKMADFKINLRNPDYDENAMRAQISQCQVNIKNIETVLASEYLKLKLADEQLVTANKILNAHQTTPCLVGAAEHDWVVTDKFVSGNFRKRKCRVCNTEQRLGS